MRSYNYRWLLACLALMPLASCQDYENGFDTETAKKVSYAKDFEKTFGTVDPNQDWSMAARFTANVELGNEVNGELKLYTDAPGLTGSKYLGRVNVVNGKATMDFDAVKGTPLFYACVKNEQGRTLSTGYYIAGENSVNITEGESFATRAASPVSKGSKVNLRVERVRAAAIEDFKAGYPSSYKNYYEMCNNLKVTDQYGYDVAKWDITNHGEAANSLMHKLESDENTLIPNLYRLNNVDFSQHDAGYTSKFLRQIFGDYTNKNGEQKEGVYKEGIDHVALIHHGTFNVEKDVVYTVGAGGGEVILDCIWRGTAGYYDYFGYYYYTGDLTTEQLWNIDKYILIDEQSAGTGMWIGGSTPNTLTQGKTAKYSTWGDASSLYYETAWENLHGEQCATYMNNNTDNLIRGTKIKLTYFDNGTPSYTFPEGTKIGFFIGWNKDTETYKVPNQNRIFFSDCAKTYELFDRPYYPNDGQKSSMTTDLLPSSFTSTHTLANGAYTGPDVRQYASTFKFGDITVLGFGDEIAGDKDLNDICFIVSGNIDEPEDNTPEDLPEPETQSWVMACEDLGGTFDYDFNDVVYSVSHATNEAKAKITALAAGGTLPVELTYNGNVLTGPNGGTHFNSWFDNGNISDEVAINAGKSTATATGKSIEIEVPLDFSVAATVDGGKMGGFAIKVYGGANNQDYTTITAPGQGATPQMMCLPSYWVWPNENDRITDAYPAFGEWGANYNVTNWYRHYNATYLVKTPNYSSIGYGDVSEIEGGQEPTPGGGNAGGNPVAITVGTYNIIVPEATTFKPSWGGELQAYKLNIGNYSCPAGLTGTVTITLESCPGNQLEIVTTDGSFLGRMGFYNGDLTCSADLTNENLQKLLVGEFHVVNYASVDVKMTSFTLVVK